MQLSCDNPFNVEIGSNTIKYELIDCLRENILKSFSNNSRMGADDLTNFFSFFGQKTTCQDGEGKDDENSIYNKTYKIYTIQNDSKYLKISQAKNTDSRSTITYTDKIKTLEPNKMRDDNRGITKSNYIPSNLAKEKEKKENNNSNEYYNFTKIKEILSLLSKIFLDKFNEKYIINKDIESVSIFKNNIKQKRNKNTVNVKKKKLLGRKNKKDDSKGLHNKDSMDNIIKKIKRIFFEIVIEYINVKIKEEIKKEIKLLRLDYANVNNLKKENELKLFNMKLKDLASSKPSRKHKLNKDEEFNKKVIKSILEKEKDKEKINNLLNMTFGEFTDVFSLKKSQDDDNIQRLEKSLLEKSLTEIVEKSDEEYFSRFVFFLFNYKAWFINKKGRNPKQKKGE